MRKHLLIASLICSAVVMLSPQRVQSSQPVYTSKVQEAPVIDGTGDDIPWQSAKPVTVKDRMAGVDITMRTVHTDDEIFFLVVYADPGEDRLHKPWIWDRELEMYQLGPQREDTFTFKWNMGDTEVDLSNFSDDNYTADVWYWKANRTDPAGYADDKSHILAAEPGKKAKELVSETGRMRYLMRLGDRGNPAQKKRIMVEYGGDLVDQYETMQPDGSRADVRARGRWENGYWTVEFARKLNTGNTDDVQFMPEKEKKYQFGLSIAGLYGEPIDRTAPHWYGQGRLSETLNLVFR